MLTGIGKTNKNNEEYKMTHDSHLYCKFTWF